MIGVSHSGNKKLGCLRGMEIQLPSDSGLTEGEECKDLKEMGHHFSARLCLQLMGGGSDSHMLPLKPGAIL